MQFDPAQTDYSRLLEARDFALASGFTEYTHVIPSSICILQGNWPDWNQYNMYNSNYYAGIKDGRIVLANNEFLDTLSKEFEWEGKLQLERGEVVVSQNFVESAYEVHGVDITLGSFIDLDLLRFNAVQSPKDDDWGNPEELGRTRISSLKVVGIYNIVTASPP
jgi:hypothetical protein